MAHEARYYDKLPDGPVRCRLCPHHCRIRPGETGLCRMRRNEDGTLVSLIYERVTSVGVDPIEKKPLYHFHPGSGILSLGTVGCNFSCVFCQNWQISQADSTAGTARLRCEEAVEAAGNEGSIGIAYTYNEPSIWFEYVFDTAKLAHEQGLKNVLVTNGYWSPEPLEELLPYVDAMNIDLKSMDPEFYLKLAGGRLEPVLQTIERAARDTLIELTQLIIPGYNDSDEQFQRLTDWVAEKVGPNTPVHLSAYTPRYRLQAPPTPRSTLQRAYEIVSRSLNYVYLGNILSHEGANTLCPGCGTVAIERAGYRVVNHLAAGARCPGCGRRLPVVMEGNDPLERDAEESSQEGDVR